MTEGLITAGREDAMDGRRLRFVLIAALGLIAAWGIVAEMMLQRRSEPVDAWTSSDRLETPGLREMRMMDAALTRVAERLPLVGVPDARR